MKMKTKEDSKKKVSKVKTIKTKESIKKDKTIEKKETTKKKEIVKKVTTKTPGSFGNVLSKILNQEVKESKSILAKSKSAKDETKPKKESSYLQKQKEKFDWEEMCRVKPEVLDREKEKKLQRIATRGVVTLFNAVRQQQKTVNESKKDKKSKVPVTEAKKHFIGKLNTETTAPEEEDVTWKALRDDFMSNTTTKDWDKEDGDDDYEPE